MVPLARFAYIYDKLNRKIKFYENKIIKSDKGLFFFDKVCKISIDSSANLKL